MKSSTVPINLSPTLENMDSLLFVQFHCKSSSKTVCTIGNVYKTFALYIFVSKIFLLYRKFVEILLKSLTTHLEEPEQVYVTAISLYENEIDDEVPFIEAIKVLI